MRRSEKIERFLESRPQATERDLQKKFKLSYREAKSILAGYRGEPKEQVVEEASFWRGLFSDIRLLFASPKRTAVVLVVIASFWRFFYLLFFAGDVVLQIPLLDAEYYLKWADEIVSQGWLGSRVFFTEPFYAYFLAILIKLFGRESLLFTAFGIQFLLGALFPALLYFFGREVLSEKVGRVAGLLAAFYGPFLFYEGLFLKTSFEVYSLPVFLFIFWRALEKPRRSIFVLAGITLGLVALIKGNSMAFLPVGIFLIFFLLRELTLQKKFLYSSLFFSGVLACILPVAVRNYVVSHDVVPTNYSIGLVLYQGNWWGGDGSTARVPSFLRPHPKYEETDAVKMAEAFEGRELKASEVSRFWITKTAKEVLDQPVHFVKTLGHKILLLLNYRDYSDNYSYAYYRSHIPFLWILPSFFLIAVLGLGGLWVLLSRYYVRAILADYQGTDESAKRKSLWRAKWMLGMFFLAYIGVLLLTTINSRYRMPLVPFLMLFAGINIAFLFERFYERVSEGVRLLLIVMGIAVVLIVLPLSIFKHLSFADAYHNIGYWYFKKGDHEQAQIYFQKAIKDDKEYAWSYRAIFHIALLEGRYDGAKKNLEKLITIRSDDLSIYRDVANLKRIEKLPKAEAKTEAEKVVDDEMVRYDADFYEGSRMVAEGNDAKAEELFQKTLAKDDQQIPALLALASLKTKQKNEAEARTYLRRAIDINEDLFVARYNLANSYIRENDYTQISELLAPVYEFAPELGETWYNYAIALIRTNKSNEAMPVVEAYVERYKNDTLRKEKVAKFEEFLKAAKDQSTDNLMNQATQEAK